MSSSQKMAIHEINKAFELTAYDFFLHGIHSAPCDGRDSERILLIKDACIKYIDAYSPLDSSNILISLYKSYVFQAAKEIIKIIDEEK